MSQRAEQLSNNDNQLPTMVAPIVTSPSLGANESENIQIASTAGVELSNDKNQKTEL